MSACSPQNATQERALVTNSVASARAVAVDVQKNTEARHFAVLECTSPCSLVHWRTDGTTERHVTVTTSTAAMERVSVAAMDDGSAVLTWMQRTGSLYAHKYALVSDAGAVSGPFDLSTPGQEYATATLVDRPIALASGGGSAYALYLGGADGIDRLWYRRLLPGPATAPVLVQDISTFGGTGYIGGLSLKVDPAGNAHMAWRYVKIAGFSAVGYARVTTPGGPVSVIEVENNPLGTTTLSEPSLVLDIATATPRAHVAYKRLNGSVSGAFVVARYDNALLQATRVLTLTGADGWVVGGGVEAPSLALNGVAPALAFSAKHSPEDGAFFAYLWRGSGVPQRVSAVGGLFNRDIVAVSMGGAAPLPFVAYRVVTTTVGASGLYVYDSVFSRTVTVANDPFCTFGYCTQSLAVAAHGNTLTGVWLAKKDGTDVYRAYEARNDTSPRGYLPVTTLTDSYIADNTLSLREAMAVANGTLTSTFGTGERALLENGGCIFNGSGAIIGGCGANITDTVAITPGLVGTITLQAFLGPLPAVNDTQPTRLEGPSELSALEPGTVVIDGKNIASLSAIFNVTSARNQITGWTLINAQRGIRLGGSANQLAFITAYSHTVAALDIDGGDRNAVFYFIAAPLQPNLSCDHGRNENAVTMGAGAQSNRLGTALLICARRYGLVLDGAGTISNSIEGSFLGAPFGGSLGNQLGGAAARNNAHDNMFTDVTIVGNGGPGLSLDGVNRTVINGGTILTNSGPGIDIGGTAGGNVISGTLISGNTTGIRQQPGAGANFWSRMAVYSNAALGIDTGVIGAVDAPSVVVDAYNPVTGQLSGTLTYGGAPVAAVVDVYAADADPSGYGEGRAWLGAVTTTSTGVWTIALPPGNACVTIVVSLPSGSSEFSQVLCRYPQLLPIVSR